MRHARFLIFRKEITVTTNSLFLSSLSLSLSLSTVSTRLELALLKLQSLNANQAATKWIGKICVAGDVRCSPTQTMNRVANDRGNKHTEPTRQHTTDTSGCLTALHDAKTILP